MLVLLRINGGQWEASQLREEPPWPRRDSGVSGANIPGSPSVPGFGLLFHSWGFPWQPDSVWGPWEPGEGDPL